METVGNSRKLFPKKVLNWLIRVVRSLQRFTYSTAVT